MSKQIDEYDVTNGELKEEVETLEVNNNFAFSYSYIRYLRVRITNKWYGNICLK